MSTATSAQTSLEYFLDINLDTVEVVTQKPKWHIVYCTPNMKLMRYNIERAWESLDKLFLKQPKYEGSDHKKWNRHFVKSQNIITLVHPWSCVIGAQAMLKSCQKQSDSEAECDHLPVNIPTGLMQNFNFNRNTHQLYMALRLVMSQYGRVFDGIRSGNIADTWQEEKQYKIKEAIEPFDVQADVRALVRLAAQLLSRFDENNPQIDLKIPLPHIDQTFARAWLPSCPNDGRFQLIMACAIAKFANMDLCIRPIELVQAFRSKTKPIWWKYLQEQLPEQNRDKLDFLFTDWTEHELVHNLGHASELLALLQLEWHEPSIEHLAFELDLDRELETIEKKLKLLDRFLLAGKQKAFETRNLDMFTCTGSWAQISRVFYNGDGTRTREFYHKLTDREDLGLAHNFPPFTISEYDLGILFPELEHYHSHSNTVVLIDNEKNFKNYLGISWELSTKSNNVFPKPIYFTPCIPTLYRNLEAAWKVAYPKHLANSRIPVDTLERALHRHVMAAGFLVCAYSICQSCLENCRPKKRSVQSFVHNYEFYFYLYPLDDAKLRLFSSVFEIAAQYGRVWCDETQQDLLPIRMESVVHALVRVATQLTAHARPYQFEVLHSGNPSIVKTKFQLSDEQIPSVITRSWLPTIFSNEGALVELRATDCRFLFLLARQIGQFLAPECANCISPMKFVKFVEDNQYPRVYSRDSRLSQQDKRPKWWPILLDKLPANCRTRLEFIFNKFTRQTFVDNLGDETGRQLLTLLGLEWDNPQVDHLDDYMFYFQRMPYNHVHECFEEIDQLIQQYVHFENSEQKDEHFTHLRTLEHGHFGSWTQLSDPLMEDGSEPMKKRQYHRVIDNAKQRALASKFPPVVLYEYVNDRDFIGPLYNYW